MFGIGGSGLGCDGGGKGCGAKGGAGGGDGGAKSQVPEQELKPWPSLGFFERSHPGQQVQLAGELSSGAAADASGSASKMPDAEEEAFKPAR